MGHAKLAELSDLTCELEIIRKLDGIKEPRPNIFYLRGAPFLHFHTKQGRRWADCRLHKNWGPEIEVPFGANKKERTGFIREVKIRYGLRSKGPSSIAL